MKEFLRIYFNNIKQEEFYSYIDIIQNGTNLQRYFAGKKLSKRLKEYKYLSFWEENYINISQFSIEYLINYI